MQSWGEFAELEPDLAAQGRQLLYRVGVGLAFLSTVRPDGGPRVHPMCPLLRGDGLYGFIIPSPKQRDLHRDGRYALHSFPTEVDEDAFSVTGLAAPVEDERTRSALARQFVEERQAIGIPEPAPDHVCFEFFVGSALLTRTTGHGDVSPVHTVWPSRAGAAGTIGA